MSMSRSLVGTFSIYSSAHTCIFFINPFFVGYFIAFSGCLNILITFDLNVFTCPSLDVLETSFNDLYTPDITLARVVCSCSVSPSPV